MKLRITLPLDKDGNPVLAFPEGDFILDDDPLVLGVVHAQCRCKPWEQSWHPTTPGVCSTCGGTFAPYSKAREVCLKTEGCCLLPGHEGECRS
jgi:hypothetical protein